MLDVGCDGCADAPVRRTIDYALSYLSICLYLISSMIRAVSCQLFLQPCMKQRRGAQSTPSKKGLRDHCFIPTALEIVCCNLAQGPIQTRCASRPKWLPIINGERLQRWAAMLELKTSVM